MIGVSPSWVIFYSMCFRCFPVFFPCSTVEAADQPIGDWGREVMGHREDIGPSNYWCQRCIWSFMWCFCCSMCHFKIFLFPIGFSCKEDGSSLSVAVVPWEQQQEIASSQCPTIPVEGVWIRFLIFYTLVLQRLYIGLWSLFYPSVVDLDWNGRVSGRVSDDGPPLSTQTKL